MLLDPSLTLSARIRAGSVSDGSCRQTLLDPSLTLPARILLAGSATCAGLSVAGALTNLSCSSLGKWLPYFIASAPPVKEKMDTPHSVAFTALARETCLCRL